MAQITKRTKKDGSTSYLIRVSAGYAVDGKHVTRCMTYTPPAELSDRKLEKDVQRKADEFEEAVKKGLLADSSVKFDDFLDRWFSEYAAKQLKPKTVSDYRRMRPRVSAALGHMRLDEIRPAHLMSFYKNLDETGVRQDSVFTVTPALLKKLPRGQRAAVRKAAGIGEETVRSLCNGKPVSRQTAEKVAAAAGMIFSKAFTEHVRADGKLSGSTQQHYHRMLSSVFARAVKWQLLPESPCQHVEAPKATEVDVDVLEEEDVAKLLEALQDAPTQFSVITQLALFTGARRGEICALRWSDINLATGVISIGRTVQYIAGQGLVFTAPKTKRSKRCTRVGAACIALLREYRLTQKAERLKAGSAWARTVQIEGGKVVPNDLLFTKWNGTPLDPNRITSWFPHFLAAHDLPAVHFHSLRHSNASLLIAAHVPIIAVSGRLGHAQTSTTLNIYASMIQSADAAAADALEGVFDRIQEKNHA